MRCVDRFAGFAHLPMTAPGAAADELERCVRVLGFVGVMVNGHTNGRFLDDPRFEPILSRAEALDVPIYLSHSTISGATSHWKASSPWGVAAAIAASSPSMAEV